MRDKSQIQFLSSEHESVEDLAPMVARKIFHGKAPLHWHDFVELEVVVSGRGEQQLNGHPYSLHRGCVYLLTPLDFHEVSTDSQVEIYNFMFQEGLLSEPFLEILFRSGRQGIVYFSEEEFEKVLWLCRMMEDESSLQQGASSPYLTKLLECLLHVILRKVGYDEPGMVAGKGDYVQEGVRFLKQHFKDNPSLEQTAARVNVTPNYFSQRFKEVIGRSYVDYLNDLKVSYAKKILRSSSLAVTEVCFACGFASLSNFMRIFKNRTGQTPTQYRQKKRNAE